MVHSQVVEIIFKEQPGIRIYFQGIQKLKSFSYGRTSIIQIVPTESQTSEFVWINEAFTKLC